MLTLKRISTVLILMAFSQVSLASDLKIEHVANAGVKISSGGKVVLIDALFGPHSFFNAPSESDFAQLIKQGADVAMTTHAHSDHFNTKRAVSFLKQNPQTLYISTPQALEYLDQKVPAKQMTSAVLTGFETKQTTHHGVTITSLNFPHLNPKSYGKTLNYGYIVEMNGWKVLHIGDAGINQKQIAGLKLGQRDIDVALIYDKCPEQADCLERINQMNVDHVAFMHMRDDMIKPMQKWIKENLPSAAILVTGYENFEVKK